MKRVLGTQPMVSLTTEGEQPPGVLTASKLSEHFVFNREIIRLRLITFRTTARFAAPSHLEFCSISHSVPRCFPRLALPNWRKHKTTYNLNITQQFCQVTQPIRGLTHCSQSRMTCFEGFPNGYQLCDSLGRQSSFQFSSLVQHRERRP